MHMCSYCGIEFDPSESMCPACGHKNDKPISPLKEPERVEKKEEKKVLEKKPDHGKEEIGKEDLYKEALAKLEKSLIKGKGKEEKKEPEKKETKKKEIGEEKKKSSATPSIAKGAPPVVKGIKKGLPGALHLIYTSRISYIIWFVLGFFVFSSVAGYQYSAVGWLGNTFTLLFTSDISAEAELLNVHHRINDIQPFKSFFILNGDILLLIPICASLVPLILWFIKKKQRGVSIAGNSNVFAGLILTQVSVLLILFLLRVTSFDYFFYSILLGIVLCSTILDFGILVHLFKPGDFQFGSTIIVFLYNIGIPIVLIVMSMVFDVISNFI